MTFSGTPDSSSSNARPSPPTLYGPQTPAVRRFLQRFAALAPAEWDASAAAYEALVGTRAAVAADRDLSRAVERAGRTGERDAVLGPLAQLVRVDAGQGVVRSGADADAVSDAEAPIAMHPVAEAALAALLALIVRDVLPSRAFETLYAPFEVAIPARTLDG